MTNARRVIPVVLGLLLCALGAVLVVTLRGTSPVSATREETARKEATPAERPPEELMRGAKAAIERGDLARAGSHLDALLDREPRHSQALLYRGQLRREQGDPAGALEDWRRVPAGGTDAGVAAYLQSTVVLERGDAVAAEELLLKSMRMYPQYVQPERRLLELYVVQGRREDVRRHLENIKQRRQWTVEEQVFAIVPPLRSTTPDSGAELMRSYLERRPDDVHSHRALGRYLILGQQFAEAERELRALLERHPDDVEGTALLAEALVKQGSLDAARAVLTAMPITDQPPVCVVRSWAELALAEQNWETAAKLFVWVVDHQPEDLASQYRLGQALVRLGREDEAEACLQRAERTDRLQTESLRLVWGSREKIELMIEIAIGVGDLLREMQRPREAIEWYQQVLAIAPRSSQALAGVEEATAELAQAPRTHTADSIERVNIASLIGAGDADVDPSLRADASSLAPAAITFSDRQAEVGLDFTYFNGQSKFKYLLESTGGGVGVLDYDRDGWPDLYFPQGCALLVDPHDESFSDRLFRNRAGEDFEDITQGAHISEFRYGQGIAAGDLNSDGFLDLIVANYGRNTLWENNGDGTFSDLTEESGLRGEVMSSSVALADLNQDGLLDVYIANYVKEMKVCQDSHGTYKTCNPANFEGEPDQLYLNDGAGKLTDVTEAAGIRLSGGKGLGVVIADWNRDRRPDIYVANDTTPNFLFNNTSTNGALAMQEAGLLAGVALSGDGRAEAGMGVATGDFDGNGLPDLYVTNFFQETNTMYLNQGEGIFAEGTQAAGLAEPTFALLGFGTQAGDYDRDGLTDLFVANGHIDDFRDRGEQWKMPPQLFQNAGEARFRDVSTASGDYFQGRYLGRGVARLDWNRDGLTDLVVVHQDRPVALLENETPAPGHGVVIELVGTESNRDAIGAVVTVTCGESAQVHDLVGGGGFFASNERSLCLGVGAATQIDRLEIQWPSGRIDRLEDVPTDVHLTFIEGRGVPHVSPLPTHELPGPG